MAGTNTFSPEATQRAIRLGKLLKEFREQFYRPLFVAAGAPVEALSKRQLSRLLGVSPTLINKYENGEIDPWEIRLGLIRQIATVTGLDIAELDEYFSEGRSIDLSASTAHNREPQAVA